MKFEKVIEEMLSQMNEGMADRPRTDVERLRLSIEAELDAINLYDQLANESDNEDVKKVLLDISKEEKVHAEELQAVLEKLDPEAMQTVIKAKDEVNKLIGVKSDDNAEKVEDEVEATIED